ncbi:MAG: alpha/beta fold hydrolase [Acidobacteriaceae bacterium]|nr:alpha/beta fold hydrolase [Acidobacteriaceae bacterium]MBV9781230.1 alpha/beta fold hydrolase [Acidobacteriaceae bacterium]
MRVPVCFTAAVVFGVCAGCSRSASQAAVQQEPVTFSSGDATLAGTLFLPGTPGKHPAVVLFHGSGPQARDSARAEWFAGWGVAALAYDKRGVGESTGDFRTIPFQDLVDDGIAGIDFLKSRTDIDALHIGVWGLSQGGWLGPLAASRCRDVAFVIAVSGPGVTPGEQMVFYYENELRARGFSDREIEEASALRRKVWNYLATGLGYDQAKSAIRRARAKRWYASLIAQRDHLIASFDHAEAAKDDDWYKTEMNYDPVAALRKLKVPALFLFGSDDELVPVPKSVEIIRRTLTATGHSDFTIKIFPGADHGLYLRAATGSIRLAPGYEETMKEWVLKRVQSTDVSSGLY